MDIEAEKYLQSEIDLSRLRVLTLTDSRSLSDSARNRLIEIELDFLSIDFYKLNIKSIADAKSAVSIFRRSRRDFSNIYIHKKDDMVERFVSFLESKTNLENISGNIKDIKSELRLVALARCVKNIIYYAKEKKLSSSDLCDIITNLITENKEDIFSIYNEQLSIVSESYSDRFNKKIKLNPLQDIIKNSGSGDFFVKKINFYGKDAIGIIFPSDIQSRETMWLAHKKIFIYNIDASELFSSSIRSITDGGIQKKVLILKDSSDLNGNNRLLSKHHYLVSQLFRESLSKRDSVINKIDSKNSVILTPSSRTEDYNIKISYEEFFNMAKKVINDI